MTALKRALPAVLGAAVLAGCQMTEPEVSLKPQVRPAAMTVPAEPAGPSSASRALSTYYARFQADLLAQGLLRTDGGGPDTPFTARELAENFEQIVFYDEYVRGGGLRGARNESARLRRWPDPVRIDLEFGTSVPAELRQQDRAIVRGYSARLAEQTRHPISMVGPGGNFHVLVMGEDDHDELITRVRQIVPDISPTALGIFERLPKAIHCLVVAFSKDNTTEGYGTAIALVRAEHPDLVRRSCYHEEMAQGLGLANDSPRARPSIFNDDDEFALLTTHDEMLLRMLYDPRLRIGMSADEARPIVRRMAEELVGGES
ncbi:DUF2927 domain-containing protein [Pseudooceanicola onchidii]|uniref:DUF2927 domain-containing protein n=1 Tax=Pseudooceanicola onchidii TaxID=2562279 RepID=UPI001F1012BB|nr:DUF2927 domain-containing protein [Pseudooceanicola onchidii]